MKIDDLETICSFCDDEANTKYQTVYFCSLHLIRFYLGLKYVYWID